MAQKKKVGVGIGGAVLSLALALFGNPRKEEIILVCCGLFLCLIFQLGQWVTKPSLTIAEKMGHAVILAILCSGICILYAYWLWPRWALTAEQKAGLASLARSFPEGTNILVELPPNNAFGQSFGRQLAQTLRENGAQVPSLTVIRGLGPDPEGIVVSGSVDEGCSSYRIAGALQTQMSLLGIPAFLELVPEGASLVDCHSVVIYVGKKPSES